MAPVLGRPKLELAAWSRCLGREIDLGDHVQSFSFVRTRQGGDFSVSLKAPAATVATCGFGALRDFDPIWGKVFYDDTVVYEFFGYIEDSSVDSALGLGGETLLSYTLAGSAWGDAVLRWRVRVFDSERQSIPGIMPVELAYSLYAELLARFSKLDVADAVKEFIFGMVGKGLVWKDGSPLMNHVSVAQVRTGQTPTAIPRSPSVSVSVEEVLHEFVSEDLHEVLLDLDPQGQPIIVIRPNWFVRRRDVEAEIPASAMIRFGLRRAFHHRATGWWGDPSAMGFTNLMGSYRAGNNYLPLMDTPLMPFVGMKERLLRNRNLPGIMPATENEKNSVLSGLYRSVALLRSGTFHLPESLTGEIQFHYIPLTTSAKTIRPGTFVRIQFPVDIQFFEPDIPSWRSGRFVAKERLLKAGEAAVGYIETVSVSGSVGTDGTLRTSWQAAVQGILPESPLAIPPPISIQPPSRPTIRTSDNVILLAANAAIPYSYGPVQVFRDWHRFAKGARTLPVAGLVLHHTGGATVQGAINALTTAANGTHFLIDQNGTIVQLCPLNLITYHAAAYNRFSIGIDLVGGPVSVTHSLPKTGGPGTDFSSQQLTTLEQLLRWLFANQDIVSQNAKGVCFQYRQVGTPQQWADTYVKADPLRQRPGVYAHNQLDPNKWDPCRPNQPVETFWNTELMSIIRRAGT